MTSKADAGEAEPRSRLSQGLEEERLPLVGGGEAGGEGEAGSEGKAEEAKSASAEEEGGECPKVKRGRAFGEVVVVVEVVAGGRFE